MSEAGRSKLDRCHRDAGQTPNRGCDGRREGPGDGYGPIPRLGESLHSHTSAAGTSADTPVFSVGSMTGANSGEWFRVQALCIVRPGSYIRRVHPQGRQQDHTHAEKMNPITIAGKVGLRCSSTLNAQNNRAAENSCVARAPMIAVRLCGSSPTATPIKYRIGTESRLASTLTPTSRTNRTNPGRRLASGRGTSVMGDKVRAPTGGCSPAATGARGRQMKALARDGCR
jgi:hypothetical protein